MTQLNHTTVGPDATDRDADSPSRPVANPRRTRLGADGRPLSGPVSTTGD